jgi:gas vesicle protein
VEKTQVFLMSDRDNFTSGFVVGAFLGGVVGGILGTLVASRSTQGQRPAQPLTPSDPPSDRTQKLKQRSFRASSQPDVELARRGLETKIAQLNDAIDEVRQRLGTVGHQPAERIPERSRPQPTDGVKPKPLADES